VNILPAIDLRDGRCVRLYQGDFAQQTNYPQDPVELAQKYESMGCRALHIVDLDGARSGRQKNQDIIRKILESSGLRVQLGGGIRTNSRIDSWFDCGLERVVIGSLAITEPARVKDWLAVYGPERIVLALDVNVDAAGVPYVATHGWRREQDVTLWHCLTDYQPAGVKHVLCTDISRDGAMTGPNLDLYQDLVDGFPDLFLQASGGVRNLDDLCALQHIGAQSAISGRALLDGTITAEEIAAFLPDA